MTTVRLPDDVTTWVEQVAGAKLARADRIPGGGRKEGWFVDVERDGSIEELFLRFDRSDPAQTGDPWTIRREAVVYLALQDTDIPVASVLGVHPEKEALLCERVRGQTWFSRILDPDEQLATAQDFIGHLAALHMIDPATLDLPGFPEPTSIPDLVRFELDEWERVLAHRGSEPGPALRLTLDWLRQSIPSVQDPIVLVQGDTGPGNFLYAGGRVTAIVDWELAHLGDPMDDIAWLSLRAVQEPFTHLPDRLREYEKLSGHAIDEERVRFYQVMAEAKLLVMSHGRDRAKVRADADGGGGDVGNGLIYGMLHRRLWFEAIADAVGIEPEPVEDAPSRSTSDNAWLYDTVLAQLRDVVAPRVDDALALARIKGLARVIKYLASIDRDGDYYDECELDDLEELLGRRPSSLADGRSAAADAVRAGRISDTQHLRYLGRRIARDDRLMRDASGALAERHWPPLR
ncbi:MAG: phosphotransferase family protein [Acidimicrobiia bacterium]